MKNLTNIKTQTRKFPALGNCCTTPSPLSCLFNSLFLIFRLQSRATAFCSENLSSHVSFFLKFDSYWLYLPYLLGSRDRRRCFLVSPLFLFRLLPVIHIWRMHQLSAFYTSLLFLCSSAIFSSVHKMTSVSQSSSWTQNLQLVCTVCNLVKTGVYQNAVFKLDVAFFCRSLQIWATLPWLRSFTLPRKSLAFTNLLICARDSVRCSAVFQLQNLQLVLERFCLGGN